MTIFTDGVPDSQTLKSVALRGLAGMLVAVMIPATPVIAEPSAIGSQALAERAVVTSEANIEEFSGKLITFEVSAYNAIEAQTDDTPCIAANGENICLEKNQNTVATNFLPFGTRIVIPSLGNQVYVVRDRMNRRYEGYYLDVLAPTKSQAMFIGRQDRKVIILD